MATAKPSNGRRNHITERTISAPLGIQFPSSLRDPKDSTLSSNQLETLKNDDNARDAALQHLHDHEQFAHVWNSSQIRPNTRRLMRKVVQIQTINAVCNGFYRLPDGTKINLDKNRMAYAAQNTRQYVNHYEYDENLQQRTYEEESQVIVANVDFLDAALCLKAKYPKSNPVVLNMASSKKPGGGWKIASGAQEENLHRRTNMFKCLEDPYLELEGIRDWFYNVPEVNFKN